MGNNECKGPNCKSEVPILMELCDCCKLSCDNRNIKFCIICDEYIHMRNVVSTCKCGYHYCNSCNCEEWVMNDFCSDCCRIRCECGWGIKGKNPRCIGCDEFRADLATLRMAYKFRCEHLMGVIC